jgi:hypothetical protein
MTRIDLFRNLKPELLFTLAAAALLLGIGLKAWLDVDGNWDTWAYHLPFAARLWGLADASRFVLDDYFQPRYEGFGVFGEYLQGALWTLFGRPEAANLVGYFGLLLFLLFLRRRYAVPFHLSVLALLAVPMIQAHAATAYIDLPGGIATAAVILLTYSLYAEEGPPRRRDVALLLLAAACAANIRLNHMPIVALALLMALPKILPVFLRSQPGARSRRRAVLGIAALGLALAVVFYTPLRNTLVHGNPVYPMAVKIAGVELNHTEVAPEEPQIPSLDMPRPLRWVFSTLELTRQPLYQGHWSIDQAATDHIGGFMGAYVALHLGLLGYLAWRYKSRETRVAVLAVLIMSLVTAFMPNAARLRYYMYWMIVLVSLNLYLVAHLSRLGRVSVLAWQRSIALLAGLVVLVVLADTRAVFVRPTFYSFQQFKAKKVDPKLIATIQPGEQVCLSLDHWQFQFVFVDRFQGEKRYTVKQASSAAACGSARVLD